jgi:hypothetical protein
LLQWLLSGIWVEYKGQAFSISKPIWTQRTCCIFVSTRLAHLSLFHLLDRCGIRIESPWLILRWRLIVLWFHRSGEQKLLCLLALVVHLVKAVDSFVRFVALLATLVISIAIDRSYVDSGTGINRYKIYG